MKIFTYLEVMMESTKMISSGSISLQMNGQKLCRRTKLLFGLKQDTGLTVMSLRINSLSLEVMMEANNSMISTAMILKLSFGQRLDQKLEMFLLPETLIYL